MSEDTKSPTPADVKKTRVELKDADFHDDNINELVSEGLKQYFLTNFDSAVEKLGQACQDFSAKFEKEDPLMLFYYGRALYKVAVSNSDVLGAGQARPTPGEQEERSEDTKAKESGLFSFSESYGAENGDKDAKEVEAESAEGTEEPAEDEGDEPPQEDEQEQSDFEIAWEILDLARTLFIDDIKQLEEAKKDTTLLNKRLADTYDLLGDVSLESENFNQAVEDLKLALDLKKKAHEPVSTVLSEAHFKLSLAHELDTNTPHHMDHAIHHLQETLKCVELQGDKADSTLIKDLNIKLDELKQAKAADNAEKAKVLQGLMGTQATGAPEVLNSLTNKAIDISGLVKKRKAPAGEEEGSSSKKKANGK